MKIDNLYRLSGGKPLRLAYIVDSTSLVQNFVHYLRGMRNGLYHAEDEIDQAKYLKNKYDDLIDFCLIRMMREEWLIDIADHEADTFDNEAERTWAMDIYEPAVVAVFTDELNAIKPTIFDLWPLMGPLDKGKDWRYQVNYQRQGDSIYLISNKPVPHMGVTGVTPFDEEMAKDFGCTPEEYFLGNFNLTKVGYE